MLNIGTTGYVSMREFMDGADFYAAGEDIPASILAPANDCTTRATFAADSWARQEDGRWIIYCHAQAIEPGVGQCCEGGMILAPLDSEYAGGGKGVHWHGPLSNIDSINRTIKGIEQ